MMTDVEQKKRESRKKRKKGQQTTFVTDRDVGSSGGQIFFSLVHFLFLYDDIEQLSQY
jgi:hypothetical protein